MVMREAGSYDDALNHLNKYEEQICDKLSVMEARGMFTNMFLLQFKMSFIIKLMVFQIFYLAQLHLDLKQLKESRDMYVELLNRNHENHAYYKGLETARQAG